MSEDIHPDDLAALEAEFEEAKELYVSVGFLTILWARMEGTLDLINRMLFYHAGGQELEDRLPLALDRKLTFMRLCHRDLPQLEAIRASGLHLVDEVHRLKQQRHDIIHGDAQTMPISNLDLVILKRVKKDKTAIVEHRRTIDGRDLSLLIDRVLDLLQLSNKHSHAVAAVVFPERSEDEGGSLAD